MPRAKYLMHALTPSSRTTKSALNPDSTHELMTPSGEPLEIESQQIVGWRADKECVCVDNDGGRLASGFKALGTLLSAAENGTESKDRTPLIFALEISLTVSSLAHRCYYVICGGH